MQRSLYEFAAWDSTNYSRWGSVYLEEARNLHKTHPDIYENFMRGSFSIKDTDHRFVAVGGDQKLEQTINLSSKCSDSIIGHSKQKQYFTEWNLIYHEMMALKNFYRAYANVPASTDAYQHHQSSVTFTKKHDAKIQAMVKFIEEKGSPFSSNESNLHLHNFVTKEVMTEEIKKDLLNAPLTGKNKYNEFRHDRFIEKTSRISGTIHRRNLKNMKQIKEPTNAKKDANRTIKNHNINEKSLNVARERGLSNEKILEHDIVPSNMLFEANGLITKPSKSKLIIELEKHLTLDECEFSMKGISASIVDVMNVVRKLPTSVSTFDEFIKMFKNGCYENSRRCDYVFDIYDDEPSVKDSEKQRRSQKPPIHLSTIRGDTQFPKDEASFWSSIENKSNLQKLIYEEVKGHKSEHPIVIGEVESSIEYPEWQAIRVQNNEVVPQLQLRSSYKEADYRIPAHVMDCLLEHYDSILVVSNDTDVSVILLYFMPLFFDHALKELWIKAGKGDSTRYIPLHVLYHRPGSQLCSVLPALHCLTGCDATSKIGSKPAALKAKPENYLTYFGTESTLTDSTVRKAEQFLVKVVKQSSKASNFSELRKEIFYASKSASLQDLPPTSEGLLPHIKRAFYNTYLIIHALDSYLQRDVFNSIRAFDFAYELDDGDYLPSTNWKHLDDRWSVVCKCTKCVRKSCKCRAKGVPCTKFCGCSIPPLGCKNPFNGEILAS